MEHQQPFTLSPTSFESIVQYMCAGLWQNLQMQALSQLHQSPDQRWHCKFVPHAQSYNAGASLQC